jgi:hypothetical protein
LVTGDMEVFVPTGDRLEQEVRVFGPAVDDVFATGAGQVPSG